MGRSVPADFLEQYYQRMNRAFNVDLQPVPGVIDALDHISLPTCVASIHHRTLL